MARFCANCGTEVDETAVFCPTCGQPIDQDVETQMPVAPAWPEPEATSPPSEAAAPPPGGGSAPAQADRWGSGAPAPAPADPVRSLTPGLRPDATSVSPSSSAAEPPLAPAAGPAPTAEPVPAAQPASSRPAFVEPTRVEDRPAPRAAAGTPPPPAPPPGSPTVAPRRPGAPAAGLPVTMPVTLSAWLIGGGAALAAVGALISVFDRLGAAIDVIALVLLALVAVSVFFSASIPTIPSLRLITLAVVLVVFGIALDRLGFGGAGAGELLLFLGSAAAVIGALLLELGRDQPLGGPQP